MGGEAVEQRADRQTSDHGEDRVHAAAGAAGRYARAAALVGRDKVDGPHRPVSSTARPAAIARRWAETGAPPRAPSAMPTVSRVTATPSSACSASAKPGA